jgi:hypothetical protein
MGEAANLHDPISGYGEGESEGLKMDEDAGEAGLASGATGDMGGGDEDEEEDAEYIPTGPSSPGKRQESENPTDGLEIESVFGEEAAEFNFNFSF